MKPFEEQDIVEKLQIRASIRRQIRESKMGRDRIADLCDEAAEEIIKLRMLVRAYDKFVKGG